jgi:hypothetical protein
LRIRINLSKLTIDFRIGIIERDWHPNSPFPKKYGNCGKAQTIICCIGISVTNPKCLFLIPDPIFFIPDPGSKRYRIRIRIKEFKYFKHKKLLLSFRKYDIHTGFGFFPIPDPDPGVKKAPALGSGSTTLGSNPGGRN